MKHALLGRLALAACLAAGCAAAPPPEHGADTASPATVLRGRVVDGTGAPPIEDGVVVLRGERIACVGTARACPAPRGAAIIDAGDGTILPGLIDLHVHAWDRSMLAMLLASGVTSVRDVHNTLENLRLLDATSAPAPRVFRAGPLIDGRATWPGAAVVATPDAARAAVDSIARAGVDVIKLYNGLDLESMRAAAAEARRLGKPVTVDLMGSRVDALQALDAGVEGFEHAGGFLQAYRALGGDPAREPFDAALVDSLARRVVRSGAYLVPTLIVQRQYASAERPVLEGVPMADRVPDALLGFWARWESVPPAMRETMGRGERFAMALSKRVVELGGRVGAGSDMPNPYVTPGGSLHQELELLVEAGLTPLQAIRAATGGAADILARPDLGVLEAGRAADVIVVDGNPAVDIRATRRVRHVVRDGRVLKMDSLLALAPPVRGAAIADAGPAEAAPAPDVARLRTGTFVYDIFLAGQPAGWDTTRVTAAGADLVVEQRNESSMGTGRIESRLALADLAPRRVRASQEAAGNTIAIALDFADGRVRGTMTMPPAFGGEVALDSEFPEGAHEGFAQPFLLAAMPLRAGASWQIPTFSTYIRRLAPYRIRVDAAEPVATGGGEVRAFPVRLEAGAFQQTLWISEAEPRWVVATEIPAFGYRSVARALPR